jgi:Flp pilus assembly protein protease CpaA
MVEMAFWSIPIIASGLAMKFDLRTREIPDWISIALVLLVPIRWLVVGDSLPWWHYVLGGVIALSVGLLIGKGDRFGGGDVKMFGALGLWFGIYAVVPLALWIAIAGLPLAFIAAARKHKDFAYAPAIFAGVCVHCLYPDLIQRIMI